MSFFFFTEPETVVVERSEVVVPDDYGVEVVEKVELVRTDDKETFVDIRIDL